MPSFVTHHYFAVQVRRAASPAIAELCKAVPGAYFWGSQGPDPFFFFPGLAQVGGQMHRSDVFAVFCTMAAAVHGSAAALAYLLGFCTHYALDRTVHPYIEDQTRRLMAYYHLSNPSAHKRCETDLDTAVLLELGSADPASEPAYQILDAGASGCPEAARLLAAGGGVFRESVTAGQAENALRAMYEVYRLLHAGKITKKAIFLTEKAIQQQGSVSSLIRRSKLLPEDSLNTAHRIWLDWDGRPRTEDFHTLAEEQALPLALELQRAACAACRRGQPLPATLFQLDYKGRPLSESSESQTF